MDMENTMASSGGYIANNFRRGYRAEYLAKYVISEFGPCERINPENDYGIDLIATVMKKVGSVGIVSSVYGVQVKSGDAPFHYSGDQLVDWIKAYNIPIILCRAERATGKVMLYSTWPLHHLILAHGDQDIREMDFIEEYGSVEQLKMPEVLENKATIWVGKPIVDVSSMELNQIELVAEIVKSLAEWINFDADNYFRRKANIPIVFGYLTWETNKSLDSSRREYWKPYHYSDQNTQSAIKLIQDCATLIALNRGTQSQVTQHLAQFVKNHGIDVQEITKQALGI
jgi:hypothetical protein